ncbi:surface-adhesin E family protein [Sphingomonas sp.]|uniref:surface-adhesin E family protein n=1 Tax=Sphingomonas sp. TaxID=28214 RepID=UPI002ED9C534
MSYIAPGEVAFVDLNTIRRLGNSVDGWGLNVYKTPKDIGTGRPVSEHWTQFRIDCAKATILILWLSIRENGVASMKGPYNRTIQATADNGWGKVWSHACRSSYVFNKPYSSETAAIAAARTYFR